MYHFKVNKWPSPKFLQHTSGPLTAHQCVMHSTVAKNGWSGWLWSPKNETNDPLSPYSSVCMIWGPREALTRGIVCKLGIGHGQDNWSFLMVSSMKILPWITNCSQFKIKKMFETSLNLLRFLCLGLPCTILGPNFIPFTVGSTFVLPRRTVTHGAI